MALDRSAPALQCGIPLAALIAQITGGSASDDPEHQASCRHCQAALVALRERWDEFTQLTDQPVSTPPGLHRRIMRRIWHLSGRLGAPAVLAATQGETRISGRAVARIARRAAISVPGVLLATVVSAAADPDDGGRMTLTLRLAVAFGPSIDSLAQAVRLRVGQAVDAHAGVGIAGIDIAVEDLVAPEGELQNF